MPTRLFSINRRVPGLIDILIPRKTADGVASYRLKTDSSPHGSFSTTAITIPSLGYLDPSVANVHSVIDRSLGRVRAIFKPSNFGLPDQAAFWVKLVYIDGSGNEMTNPAPSPPTLVAPPYSGNVSMSFTVTAPNAITQGTGLQIDLPSTVGEITVTNQAGSTFARVTFVENGPEYFLAPGATTPVSTGLTSSIWVRGEGGTANLTVNFTNAYTYRSSSVPNSFPSAAVSADLPGQMSGLAAWYDSRTSNWMTFSTGSQISAWVSRAGSMGPTPLTQATSASQPMYATNVGGFGGKNSVQFDGSNDWLAAANAADWTFLHNNTGATIFTVEMMDSTGSGNQIIYSTSAGAQANAGIRELYSASLLVSRTSNTTASFQNSIDITDTAHLARDAYRWRAITYGAGARGFSVSGSTISNPDIVGQVASNAAATIPFRVGITSAVNSPLKGYISQILIFNRVLSASEIEQLADWVASEYGFQRVMAGTKNYSASSYMQTVNPGGIPGVGTGFWAAALVKLDSQSVTSTNRHLFRRLTATNGWTLWSTGTNSNIRFTCYDNAQASITAPVYTLTAADVNKIHLVVAVHDGTRIRLYVSRVEVGTGTAITGFSPANSATTVGSSGNMLDGWTIFGVAGGTGVPTLSDIKAHYDAVKSAGRILAMPGLAQTDRIWNLNVAGSNTELVGGTDNLSMVGTVSTVVHRGVPWAWDRRLFGDLTGATGFTGANYYSTSGNGGIPGSVSGFWVAGLVQISNQGVANTTRHIGRSSTGGANGWFLSTTTTNTGIRFGAYDGSAAFVQQTATIAASDVNKLHLFVGVHDGSRIRFYMARAEVGSGQAITGYTLAPANTRLGDNCDGMAIFGLAGGNAVPSFAQVQAYFDAVKSAGQMVAMPGVQTDHLWIPQGGATPDLIGTDNMTVVGSLSPQEISIPWAW